MSERDIVEYCVARGWVVEDSAELQRCREVLECFLKYQAGEAADG